MIEEVSSVKCQVLRRASRAGSPLRVSCFKPHASNLRRNADCPGASCTNKPNFPATPGGTRLGRRRTRGKCAKQTQFAPPRRMGRGPGTRHAGCCTNKPNWWERTVRNKPNFRRPDARDTPSFHYSTIPAFRSDADRAKQSQTWADWGIWGPAHGGSLLCETKPFHSGGRPRCHPATGRRWDFLYKQTQLAAERCEGQVLYGQ